MSDKPKYEHTFERELAFEKKRSKLNQFADRKSALSGVALILIAFLNFLLAFAFPTSAFDVDIRPFQVFASFFSLLAGLFLILTYYVSRELLQLRNRIDSLEKLSPVDE